MGLIVGNLEGYFCALDAATLTASGKTFVNPSREAAGAAADDCRQ
jgi:hypothetical protein